MKLATIRFFQGFYKLVMAANILSFVWLGLQSLISPQIPVSVPLLSALATFFLIGVCVAVLGSAKCPACKKPFVGSTAEDGEPVASFCTACCAYCGFPTSSELTRSVDLSHPQ
ncbi:hypothetical protein [Chitinimonas lacunae]|uniref:Uncharacterized protein n=1 Tax=Chitinimonas lacunae TaxID=1963018 RepID=A0ABV8MIX5_9NEIS